MVLLLNMVETTVTHAADGVSRAEYIGTTLLLRTRRDDALINGLASIDSIELVVAPSLRCSGSELVKKVYLSLLLVLHLVSSLLTLDKPLGWVKYLALDHQISLPRLHSVSLVSKMSCYRPHARNVLELLL